MKLISQLCWCSLLKFQSRISIVHFKPYLLLGNHQKMSHVLVKSTAADERIQISLAYTPMTGDKERIYNLNRMKHEPLSSALSRLTTNIEGVLSKKMKKKKKKLLQPEEAQESAIGEESLDLEIYLEREGQIIDSSIENTDAWQDGAVLHINTANQKNSLKVIVNPPSINKLKLPAPALVNYHVRPIIEFDFVTEGRSKFTWLRSEESILEHSAMEVDDSDSSLRGALTDEATANNPDVSSHNMQKKRKHLKSLRIVWQEHSHDKNFLPSPTDEGHKFKLQCIPCRDDIEGTPVESNEILIQPDPGPCPFERRHQFTSCLTPDDQFRMVDYNILAKLYADSDFSRDYLFPQCPVECLDFDYRKQLILKELIGYNADIVCLQEVDRKFFIGDLSTTMSEHGFDCLLELKPEVSEGVATFYRKEKFRFLGSHNIDLMDTLKNDPVNSCLKESIDKNELLKEKVYERKATLQVTALESTCQKGRYLLIATTHLYFHPRGGNIRLIQCAVCINHLTKIKHQYLQQGIDASIILCGDFNSDKNYGVCKYILERHLPSNAIDWYSEGRQYLISDVELKHDLDFVSACGNPPYTNYVVGFLGCLDHIFYDPKVIDVKQIIPLPSHEEVSQLVCLPNAQFPSDHLALLCDFNWKK